MAAPPPAPQGELLTQLQDQLHNTSAMFFDFIGHLQQVAPPVSVAGEEIIAPRGQEFKVHEETKVLSSRLVASFKTTEDLINRIPQEDISEEQHYERIRQLQVEHQEVTQQLVASVESAEAQLLQLQNMYGELAAKKLRGASSKPNGLGPA